ncbi:unnamed protein product [Malus baccata var. baccata]
MAGVATTLVCVKQVKQEESEEWDESMPLPGDIIEGVYNSESSDNIGDEFFAPTKAKAELMSQLARFSNVEVIWVKVRRGDSTLKLPSRVAERPSMLQKKYTIKAATDDRHVAVLEDLTSDQCAELQEMSRSLVNVEYRGHNKGGVKYDWKMKVDSYLPDQRCTIVSSILFMPLPGEYCTEATTARCMAWFTAAVAFGAPLIFVNIQTEQILPSDKNNLLGKEMISNKQQQNHKRTVQIAEGIRLWFMPGVAEMLIELIPEPDEARFGLDIKRTEEGLICIHSVVKGSAADRSGLGSLHEEAYANGYQLVISRLEGKSLMPSHVSSTGLIHCCDPTEIKENLHSAIDQMDTVRLHLMAWSNHLLRIAPKAFDLESFLVLVKELCAKGMAVEADRIFDDKRIPTTPPSTVGGRALRKSMVTPGRALINPSLTSTDFNVAVRINSLLKILNPQKPDRSNLGLAALNRFSPLLKPSLVIHVIKSQANPHRALFFFNWASNPNPNPNNYSHTHHCYVAITDLLLSHSLFSTAASLLQESNRLNDFLVSRFIAVHGGRGDIGAAMDWFHKAKLIENGKCLFSYNAILGALVRADRMSVAKEIYDQIVKEGVVKPDVSTCSVMINGFCQMGEMDNAQKVFDEMICEPDVITYTTMIRGFCKMGDFVSARKVCGQMREKKDCLPNTVTYSILIDGYCKKGELEEAIKCMNEMEEQGCEPNQVTYSALIHGFCKKGDLDSARKVFDKMICEPDVITYNNMILGYCKKGDLDSARKVFDKMICEPDVITYNNMILGYCKKGDLDSARKVFCQMREKKDCLPNTVTYSILIDGYCKKGELEEAIKCMNEMEKQGCEPNLFTYSSLIHGFCKTGDLDRARRVLSRMRESKDCLPNTVTYTTLIDGYCKKGELEEAMKCMSEMEKQGCEPNQVTYSALIHGFCKMGEMENAQKLFDEMTGDPDLITYNTMIHGFCKTGDFDSARRVLSQMRKEGRVG